MNQEVNVADTLCRLRKQKHLSKEAMANIMMVDVRTYTRYENGCSEPTVSELTSLFNELNINVDKALVELLHPELNQRLSDGSIIFLAQIDGDYQAILINGKTLRLAGD